MIAKVRPKMCEACPYAKDVPSGVWSKEEYDKLREYDNPMHLQPTAPFACHAAPKLFCHGWAACHDSLALRIAGIVHGSDTRIPKGETRPIFESGNAAADHGCRQIEKPGRKSREMATRLLTKHKRLREQFIKNKTTPKP